MRFENLSKDAREYIKAVIECIDDGIFILDDKSTIMEINEKGLGTKKREDIVGKTMQELVDEGIYRDSCTLKVLKSGEKETLLQYDETETLTTGIPYIKDGKINMIVCCERELKEIDIMKEQLRINEEKLDKYKSEIRYLRSIFAKETKDLVLESPKMKQVVELALTAAKYDSRVLIEGETGVGKEIIAKLIYRNGVRKNGPFIAVNCSAIPETLIESELFGYEKGSFTGADEKGKKGYFELANKGVIFLDEIGEISLSFQSKLLRTLQENEILRIGGKQSIKIDVQVIAATNKNLAEKVQTGEFKADLFYRLNTFPIMIPPLRERQADIVPLIYSFADKFNKKYGTQKRFSLSSLNALQVYEWPGNVRELENIVERLVLTVHDDVINAEHVGMILGTCKKDFNGAGERGTLREVSEHAEKELIKKYMEIYDNPEDLEKALDVSRATLNRKLLKYDLR